jgi:pilus assembly protein CpaB
MRGILRWRLLWALLFGLVTAGLIVTYLQRLPQGASDDEPVTVFVAARDLEPGTVLRPDMLRAVQWPAQADVPGLVRDAADVAGERLTVVLLAGQPVLAHLVSPLEAVGHGGRIPLGMRLITIGIDEPLSIGYRLRPGDRVDLLTVYKDARGLHSELAIQSVEVYGVGHEYKDGKQGEPRTVTLLVSPQQALAIALYTDEKSLRLVLRAAGDSEEVEVDPISRLK